MDIRTDRSLLATEGMITTAHPRASLAGLDVLRSGGNAMDAALAAAAVTNVVLPAMCGLGGDLFLIYYDAEDRRFHAINSSGIAPRGASVEYFRDIGYEKMPLEGILSVAVPGQVEGYRLAHSSFATRGLDELFAPAINLAHRGFIVTPQLHNLIGANREKLSKFPESRKVFLPEGEVPEVGDILIQNNLAHTFEGLLREGLASFYRGFFAEALEGCSDKWDGLFAGDEMPAHKAQLYEPLKVDYRGFEVHQTAPVSQGFLLLEELKIIEGFDLPAWGTQSPDAIHAMVEAKKLAFSDRNAFVGDPGFVDFSVEKLLTDSHARKRRDEICMDRASEDYLPGDPHGDTTYLCVVDGEGNACSLIHSLSMAFGSGLAVEGTGVLLNNRAGRGFTLEGGHPNCIAGGKKTMHTLNCYAVSKGDDLLFVGGTPGGDGQPQWNMQVISHILDGELSPQEAVEAPRWRSFPGTDPATSGEEMTLLSESRIPEGVREELMRRGHRVETLAPWAGGGRAQVILKDPSSGLLVAGSDPRQEGAAMGL
ncbi:MAG: gamma-glutamyltransferase family protein [Bacillota bacterium]